MKGLERVSFPLVPAESPKAPKKAIRCCSVEEFKGLEADAIVLADVDDLDGSAMREIIYVGTSRARVFLGIFISEGVRDSFDRCGTIFGTNLGKGAL
jgi:hypothetical protein